MKILAIDTAMSACSVGLVDFNTPKQRTEFVQSIPMIKGHAEKLVPMIESVMQESESSFDDIDLLAVTKGPGAFTGIRVGLATARGMSLALSIPIVGITTTQAVVNTYLKNLNQKSADLKPSGKIITLIETKRKDYYCEVFDGGGNIIVPVSAIDANEVAKHIASKKDVLIGDAVQRFINEKSDDELSVNDGNIINIDVLALAEQAIEKYDNNQITNSDSLPVYVGSAGVSFSKKTTKTIAGL